MSLFDPPGGVAFSYLVIIKSMTHTNLGILISSSTPPDCTKWTFRRKVGEYSLYNTSPNYSQVRPPGDRDHRVTRSGLTGYFFDQKNPRCGPVPVLPTLRKPPVWSGVRWTTRKPPVWSGARWAPSVDREPGTWTGTRWFFLDFLFF